MSSPSQAITPALVTQKAVQRLPRWALLLFCVAYVLPGLFGRDPWKSVDIASFGHMWGLAQGHTSWLHPNVGGVLPSGGGILPYWLGGAFIAAFSPWVEPALSARVPFALLLAAVLTLTWYATYHLARTKAAQPLPLAFGGEALPADYARAVADGALLALIASLGLLQLGHETTPELLQLTGSALFLYGMAAAATRPGLSRAAILSCLPIMAASGSPTVAVELSMAGVLICALSKDRAMRAHLPWVAGSGLLAAALATALSGAGLSGWAMRLEQWPGLGPTLSLFTWFTWPVLPLAALTTWHWRRQVVRRHIAVPLFSALVGFGACIAMGANDRALLQALPALAVLAAFALPILQRSLGSAIDWFSVFFFTTAALLIWLTYGAMYTGVPAKMASNVAKLVPGYSPHFSWLALALSAAGTVLWLALVRWRTARQAAVDDPAVAATGPGPQLPPAGQPHQAHGAFGPLHCRAQRIDRLVDRAGILWQLQGGWPDAAGVRAQELLRADHQPASSPSRAGGPGLAPRDTRKSTDPQLRVGHDLPPRALSASWRYQPPSHPRCGHGQDEDRALALLAGDPKLAAMALHHVLDDGQPQARAARLARTAAVHAVKAFGQARNVLWGDADAAVAHTELAATIGQGGPAHIDGRAVRGVAHGVGHQIAHGTEPLAFDPGDFGLLSRLIHAEAHGMALSRQAAAVAFKALHQVTHPDPTV